MERITAVENSDHQAKLIEYKFTGTELFKVALLYIDSMQTMLTSKKSSYLYWDYMYITIASLLS